MSWISSSSVSHSVRIGEIHVPTCASRSWRRNRVGSVTLSPGDDVLDEAYERLFAYGPEFEGYLSNHGPMVVKVLERNHRSDATHAWLDR